MEWFLRWEIIDGLDGNRLLKAYTFLMEDKMAAEAFGHAKNYGWDSPFKGILEDTKK